MAFPNIAKKLFHNNRVYIWIAFCNLYGLYWLFFCHAPVLSGFIEVVFDPLAGYRPIRKELFEGEIIKITIHDILLAIGSPIIYTLFGFCLYFKIKEMTTRVTKDEIMVFIQVFIISMLNISDGLAYAYKFKYPDSGFWLTIVSHFSWLHIHGLPPVIYLILNKTVRKDTKAIFQNIFNFLKKVKVSNSIGSLINNQQTIHNMLG
uniref:Uncharacterized protein n=1 Tax=Meloidogyne enterolobii TaxID=390850 RepID=A0A6V7WW65_MELEN|nr:unnamed protein product [Meloidogyne enterolobii]